MKKADIIAVLSLVLGIIGLWLVDIGQSKIGVLGNGFYEIPTVIVFHIGLYLALIALVVLFLSWLNKTRRR